MVVIVEGIDRVGKTTLVDRLKSEFGFESIKQNRIGGNSPCGEVNSLMNVGRSIGTADILCSDIVDKNVVFDRFHWTDAVYGKLERHDFVPYMYVPVIEAIMKNKKEKFLIVKVDPTDISWSSKQHGKSLTDHQELFCKLYEECTLDKITCTYETYQVVIDEISRRLRHGQK